MPIREFKCTNCEKITEKIIKNNLITPPVCECGRLTVEIISKTNFNLSGDGWYKGGFNGKGKH